MKGVFRRTLKVDILTTVKPLCTGALCLCTDYLNILSLFFTPKIEISLSFFVLHRYMLHEEVSS